MERGEATVGERRHVWRWLLLALLLLGTAIVLLLALHPDAQGKPVAYSTRDRILILLFAEGGWLTAIFGTRAVLVRRGAGVLARAGRLIGGVIVVGGLGIAVAGGWLLSRVLASESFGTSTGHEHHHHWD